MRGIGGPILCIGDLLSDVGAAAEEEVDQQPNIPITQPPHIDDGNDNPLRLNQLFEENYDQLNKALEGTDDSWTSLTLKLCTALDTANKLIQSANSNATLVSHKVGELEKIMGKGDSVVAEVRSIHSSLSQRISPTTRS